MKPSHGGWNCRSNLGIKRAPVLVVRGNYRTGATLVARLGGPGDAHIWEVVVGTF